MGHFISLPQETILWGENSLPASLSRFPEFGISRPVVFTADVLEALAQEHVLPHLAELHLGLVTDLPAHAPDTGIRAALEACKRLGAGSIIAVGGGSVLDAAKAVSYLHYQETGRYLPIAALPTTVSGSEYSHYFGITETDGPQLFKRSYAVRETTPKVVALDPVLLRTAPRGLLLSSAIKGIDHAVEGMRKVEADHPHAIIAADGVNRFLSVLERWPSELSTQDALAQGLITDGDLVQLQLGGWYCYFTPASMIYGLSHRIGHILGGTFELPHSMTSCITLAPVIRACADMYGGKLNGFVAADARGNAAAALADRIERTVRSLGLPSRISAFGLSDEKLPEVSRLLRESYPNEVADLGGDAARKLDDLLEAIW
ncbi:iron-containing alcohol dehydrogenase [Leisingera sp. ANG-Vp]|uniref:iron-containing alcohol dehydrogenase n=1 Tax=Leisingera sp. ANG-Vp TaxID=1577896 RepID=UPI00057E4F6B|nr:iron-containing alcohol dehydrogenase [Leisingera sp. ANG-Vp]KIC20701.1 alcohol dehydrogenase [Leisingera sp. ANG-Vp]